MGSQMLHTVLDIPGSDPAENALAVLHLRRLANRHGCHEDHCKWPEPGCARCRQAVADAHNADVTALHEWLQACGLEPYERMPQTSFVPSGAVHVSYRRPL